MPYEGKTFAEHGGSLERKNRILGHMKGKHLQNMEALWSAKTGFLGI